MITKTWTFKGRIIEIDFILHKATPDTSDTPGEVAYIEIHNIRFIDSPFCFSINDWNYFMEYNFETFQADILEKKE